MQKYKNLDLLNEFVVSSEIQEIPVMSQSQNMVTQAEKKSADDTQNAGSLNAFQPMLEDNQTASSPLILDNTRNSIDKRLNPVPFPQKQLRKKKLMSSLIDEEITSELGSADESYSSQIACDEIWIESPESLQRSPNANKSRKVRISSQREPDKDKSASVPSKRRSKSRQGVKKVNIPPKKYKK